MGILHIILTMAALLGLAAAVMIEIKRERKEGEKLQELRRRLAAQVN